MSGRDEDIPKNNCAALVIIGHTISSLVDQ